MSRSMFRKDFIPNRLSIALQTVRNFIQKKFILDPKDRICLISFGNITKKLSSFEFEEEKLFKSLKKIHFSGKGSIHDAIAFALQLLVVEMRKIGGKIQRIFIISDDKLSDETLKLNKIIKLAKGLGIFIDSCQIGKTQDSKKSILKKVSQMTGGEFGFFNNSKAMITAGQAFASKKDIKKASDFFDPNKKDKLPPLVSEIAVSLRRPTMMEVRMMMKQKEEEQEKCHICHSIIAPLTNADFLSEGRYCPSCDRPIHLTCAGMWAKKSEYNENVFRCPFCFFLLEIPKSVSKLVDDELEEKKKNKEQTSYGIKIIEDDDTKTSDIILIPNDKVEGIDASCSYCHSIFLGEFKVFKCFNCGSYYHEPCLKKMYDEVSACRYCGSKITNDY